MNTLAWIFILSSLVNCAMLIEKIRVERKYKRLAKEQAEMLNAGRIKR